MEWLLFPFDFLERIYYLNKTSFSREKLKKGKKYAKKVHCIIGSLIRDGEDSYSYGVNLIEIFSKIFKTVDVFILENDSKDNTKKLWEKYSTKCPENVKLIIFSPSTEEKDKTLKYKTVNHEVTNIRIKKMVKLRNILLETIKTKSRKFDYESYVFITDLDIKGKLLKEGLYDTFYHFKKKNKIEAIGCNGITWNYLYFDSYAYKNIRSNPVLKIGSSVDIPINNGLYPVISSFSGGMFYKYNIFVKLKYKLRKNGEKIICEHVTLNEKIKNIFINTNMIYYIKSH